MGRAEGSTAPQRKRHRHTLTPKVMLENALATRWFGGSRGEEGDTVTGQQKSAYNETSSPVETVLLVASCTHTHIHPYERNRQRS